MKPSTGRDTMRTDTRFQMLCLLNRMPSSKPSRPRSKPASPSAFEKAMHDLRQPASAFPNVSLRWLLSAIGVVLLGAVVCAWLALCLLYWQGSWQLLYHPKPAMTRSPASVGLPFETIHFAATETGTTQLTGWWLPADNARFTALYLHGSDGNLSDTVDTLAALHRNGLAVFAIDYRGYGQSTVKDAPLRPSEKQLRQDAEWALTWLTLTRGVSAKSIVICGSGLGANLAAEVAADHGELAGLILDQPLQNPMAAVFNDPRSHLVPASQMVKDRYDLNAAAQTLRIPSLWLLIEPGHQSIQPQTASSVPPEAYAKVQSRKQSVWLTEPIASDPHFVEILRRWLDDLGSS